MQTVPTPAGERVAEAVAALRSIGGDDIDRDQAGDLLREWPERDTLTLNQIVAVLQIFPPPSEETRRARIAETLARAIESGGAS